MRVVCSITGMADNFSTPNQRRRTDDRWFVAGIIAVVLAVAGYAVSVDLKGRRRNDRFDQDQVDQMLNFRDT